MFASREGLQTHHERACRRCALQTSVGSIPTRREASRWRWAAESYMYRQPVDMKVVGHDTSPQSLDQAVASRWCGHGLQYLPRGPQG